MLNKFEMFGIAACIGLMGLAIFLVQAETSLDNIGQTAAVVTAPDVTVVPEDGTAGGAEDAVLETNVETMKIDDIKLGSGPAAVEGNSVAVHYAGRLSDGTEFDNSLTRGAPIEFTIGAGQVIAGWEEGIVGMQVGGERILVIPPDKAYGEQGIGPIPPNATLEFTVELVAIN